MNAICFHSIFTWGIFCVQSISNTSLCHSVAGWGIINCCYNTHAWDRRVHTLALTNDSVLLMLMTATLTGPSDRPCARVCCANLSPVGACTSCWSVCANPLSSSSAVAVVVAVLTKGLLHPRHNLWGFPSAQPVSDKCVALMSSHLTCK